jgi:uncharacterized protein (DUF433 family)
MRTKLVTIDPEIMSGEPVFTGTRVPVKSLIDHLREGDTLANFLEGFPSVKRAQAVAVLEQANQFLLEHYRSRMTKPRPA